MARNFVACYAENDDCVHDCIQTAVIHCILYMFQFHCENYGCNNIVNFNTDYLPVYLHNVVFQISGRYLKAAIGY